LAIPPASLDLSSRPAPADNNRTLPRKHPLSELAPTAPSDKNRFVTDRNEIVILMPQKAGHPLLPATIGQLQNG